MSKRDNFALVQDMLESAEKIHKYTKAYDFSKFIKDDRTIDAVIRNFEVIGEAASRIEPDFQLIHSQIPWRKLKGYRNKLIHEYFGVDYQIVWEIIQDELTNLISSLEEISDTEN